VAPGRVVLQTRLMAVTTTIYNHTRALFLSGANSDADEYRINLYSALPANLTATTKTAAEASATQIGTSSGYTQNDKIVTGVAVTTESTDDGMFDADDVIWTATGGSIAAGFAMLYNETDGGIPVLRIDFGGTVTAASGIDFVIRWNAAGIFTLA